MKLQSSLSVLPFVLAALTFTPACSPSDDRVEPTDGGADAVTDAAVIDATPLQDGGSVIVTYRYGNQITGSTLEILADGTVTGTERSCCPPHTEPAAGATLTPLELSALRADVAAAMTLPVTTEENADGAAGRDTASSSPLPLQARALCCGN